MSFNEAIAFAQDLIRIPSLPGQEGDLAARVLAEFKRLRFDDVWTDDAGNCYGRIKGRGDGRTLMLNCHLDMVDVGDAASWEIPPFEGRIADGFLHGRGAMDIKGPLALQTHAAAEFAGDPLPGDLLVVHTVYEEKGGWGMQHLLERGEVKPDAVIIGEATNGDICIGHRGRAEVVVELKGVAAHASAPERARNPIELLPEVLPRLERFAAALPVNDVLGPSTMAATQIETLPRSRNVIPDRVRIIFDWRVLHDVTHESALHAIKQELSTYVCPDGFSLEVRLNREPQRTYTGLERERLMFTPGFLIDAQHAIVRTAHDVVAAQTGAAPVLRPWTFATDGGHACGVHDIPCIGYAPGDERYAHTNRERLELRQAEQVYGVYPALIRAVHGAIGK